MRHPDGKVCSFLSCWDYRMPGFFYQLINSGYDGYSATMTGGLQPGWTHRSCGIQSVRLCLSMFVAYMWLLFRFFRMSPYFSPSSVQPIRPFPVRKNPRKHHPNAHWIVFLKKNKNTTVCTTLDVFTVTSCLCIFLK